jgi:molybdopterin molybdotransferase
MDGIALCHAPYAGGQRTFPIIGVAAAGAPQMTLAHEDTCLEVMTGAMLPAGCDTVIRYEDLEIKDGRATILVDDVQEGKNVHRQGEDRRAGSLLIPAPRLLSPAEIGIAVTIGKAQLTVSRLPKTMIVSTGDELVDITETPAPHQIRKSNVYRLLATLESYGLPCNAHHLPDDYETTRSTLEDIIADHEVILLSGGVSKGKFDYVPKALESLGVEQLFYRVRQRPGKPLWVGKATNGTLIFALPGNPVSSFMCTHIYFLPWLRQAIGLPPAPQRRARLTADYTFKPDLTYFLQVRLSEDENGGTLATPVSGHGSGDLANLAEADAFLELPQGKDHFKAGEVYPYFPYR